mmetsp:Transcript_32029/g.75092  ORF Transcript_32029/g.75092 Transcript_32029/m.75092 type:complete len:263 (+) Transcript_32029:583-1371(+)
MVMSHQMSFHKCGAGVPRVPAVAMAVSTQVLSACAPAAAMASADCSAAREASASTSWPSDLGSHSAELCAKSIGTKLPPALSSLSSTRLLVAATVAVVGTRNVGKNCACPPARPTVEVENPMEVRCRDVLPLPGIAIAAMDADALDKSKVPPLPTPTTASAPRLMATLAAAPAASGHGLRPRRAALTSKTVTPMPAELKLLRAASTARGTMSQPDASSATRRQCRNRRLVASEPNSRTVRIAMALSCNPMLLQLFSLLSSCL